MPDQQPLTTNSRVINSEIIGVMQKAYLDYAMSVIVARALPDVRDGLKPVHRKILFAMHQVGLMHSAKYSKSAKIVGEVLGKYHPHSDTAVYDALVRMAQNFSMRYPLIEGQGNFGSIDGDSPAAMRYTEAKLAKIASEMLADIKKETVNFSDNFDATLKEPDVLPTKLPNLLLNGSEGIAVGMATKIPPHNLKEVVDCLVFMLDEGILEKQENEKENEEFELKKLSMKKTGVSAQDFIMTEVRELEKLKFEFESATPASEFLKFIKGPDFPTFGQIFDKTAITELYTTGKGKIPIRGKAEIEEGRGGRFQIIISELPYQVNKAELVAKIADLAKEKKIVGISDLRDESDRRGIRVVVEMKKSAKPKSILNKLYKLTNLQTSFPANLVALVDGVPQTLNLRQILLLFLRHREEIVRRRTVFDFKEAKFRAHILEGLKIALDNLDAVIETIKKSKDAETAKTNLMEKFNLTDLQATAILDMQLRRLAALEREKIEAEYKEIQKILAGLREVLTKPEKMVKVIRDELLEVKEKYGDNRRTKIFAGKLENFQEEDLVPEEQTIVTVTKTGYIKRVAKNTFKIQKRGGKGVVGMATKEEDEIEHIVSCTTHDFLLFFTNKGRVFQLRVWEIGEASRQSKGQAIINLVNVDQKETVKAILKRSAKPEEEEKFILLVTKKGLVKKTALEKFANLRASGLIAIKLRSGDELCWVKTTDGKSQIFLASREGKCVRFSEKNVRPMGRAAAGVRGIRLRGENEVVGMDVLPEKLPKPKDGRKKVFRHLLVVTEKGLGKRTNIYNYPLKGRGGVGVKIANLSEKTGKVACARVIDETVNQIIIVSKHAQVIKLPTKNIPVLSRATQGVILMRLKNTSDSVAALTCLNKQE